MGKTPQKICGTGQALKRDAKNAIRTLMARLAKRGNEG